ncbi:MAG: hypothetical protein IAE81_13740, partial [Caldilineaceae bacterium]|nr:hypothetical protein [Caldilineaceae bacterium]
MTVLTLHDFELEIDVGDGIRYPVAVLRSPAGAARAVMDFPFSREMLAAELAAIEQVLLGGASPGDGEQVQRFGAALFDALIQGD